MVIVVFKGKNISKKIIQMAIVRFDMFQRDTNDYENWLDKETYKHALSYEGKFYPPKHILSLASDIKTTEFSGGEQTNKVFRKLGFIIVNKPKR